MWSASILPNGVRVPAADHGYGSPGRDIKESRREAAASAG